MIVTAVVIFAPLSDKGSLTVCCGDPTALYMLCVPFIQPDDRDQQPDHWVTPDVVPYLPSPGARGGEVFVTPGDLHRNIRAHTFQSAPSGRLFAIERKCGRQCEHTALG